MLNNPACASGAFCNVTEPPLFDQPAVDDMPYSRLPFPAMFTGDAKQAVALQKPPQSPSTAHVVRQTGPAVSHLYAPHDVAAPALHAPAPLHVDAAVAVAPVHAAARQTVPAAQLRHAPAPSQKPSLPHVDCSVAEHMVRGLVPLPAGTHVPMLPTCAQVLHAPVQAVSQHTSSTQLPLAHWLAVVHAMPLASFGTHEPAGQ